MEPSWWETFFDRDYIRLWSGFSTQETIRDEVAGLWDLLELERGSRVLDAPCGYGRLSRPLAKRGAVVLGVDQAAELIEDARATRGDLPADRLRYLRHDLRERLPEEGFDAAFNVFTSLGYGSEEDDRRILTTLAQAVRSGGRVLVETNHRDAVVAMLSRGCVPSVRLADGTLIVEEPRLDAVKGRIETAWHWSGPEGSGVKRASLRVYTISELARLLAEAGLRLRSVHKGLSTAAYVAEGPDMGGRAALLADRP